MELVNHHPAWNPFAMSSDNIGFTTIHAPRIVFHEGFPLLNTGIDWALKKVHTPDLIRKVVVIGGLPLLPHLNQMREGLQGGRVYQLNFYDWIYDFSNKQPITLTKQDIARRLILNTALSGFARP